MFHLSDRSINNMGAVDPRLVEIATRAIQITKVDFGIPESGGLRTAEEQNRLFKDGKSKCDGYIRKSKHQDGKALDFYAYAGGKATWSVLCLAMVACAFFQAAIELGYKIEWGGLWRSFEDMPHIQLID